MLGIVILIISRRERLLLEKMIGMEMNRPGAMAMFVVDCLELLYVVEMRN